MTTEKIIVKVFEGKFSSDRKEADKMKEEILAETIKFMNSVSFI